MLELLRRPKVIRTIFTLKDAQQILLVIHDRAKGVSKGQIIGPGVVGISVTK